MNTFSTIGLVLILASILHFGCHETEEKETQPEKKPAEMSAERTPAISTLASCGHLQTPAACTSIVCSDPESTRYACYNYLVADHLIDPGQMTPYWDRAILGPFSFTKTEVVSEVNSIDCRAKFLMKIYEETPNSGKFIMNVVVEQNPSPDDLTKAFPSMLLMGILREQAIIDSFQFYWLNAKQGCHPIKNQSVLMCVFKTLANGSVSADYYDLSVPPDYTIFSNMKNVDTISEVILESRLLNTRN